MAEANGTLELMLDSWKFDGADGAIVLLLIILFLDRLLLNRLLLDRLFFPIV
jgi:hypothetical protein